MNRTITIFDEDGRPVQMFPAPADKYVARQLWVFLVDHLEPGFTHRRQRRRRRGRNRSA